ncbi:hypothetical protein FRC02_012060 [Tulasnella sp. 418]|nr:hypothetical protein FRC02_012060 [Tulasnella sp. 418]
MVKEDTVEYFVVNWFTDEWADMYTDMGLPPDQTRDGTWNTNNISESSFRQFDNVFLDNRNNKRIDRLAIIIVFDYFPYFQTWRDMGTRSPPPHLKQLNDDAHKLWDQGHVEHQRDRVYIVLDTLKLDGVSITTEVIDSITYEINLDFVECRCDQYEQTGKACVHIKAAQLLDGAGSPVEHKAIESENTMRGYGTTTKQKQPKMVTDKAIGEQYDRFMRRVKETEKDKTEAAEIDEAMALYVDDKSTVNTPGRPSAAEPLQPWRRKRQRIIPKKGGPEPTIIEQKKRPVFQAKPGPPKPKPLGPSSLFSLATAKSIRALRSKMDQTSPTRANIPNTTETSTASLVPNSKETLSASLESGELNAEETSMVKLDFSRWRSPDYTLRSEDAHIICRFLNSLSWTMGRGILFLEDTGFTGSLAKLDWSVIGTEGEELKLVSRTYIRTYQCNVVSEEPYAKFPMLDDRTSTTLFYQVYKQHKRWPFEHVVFMLRRGHHWVSFHHDLSAPLSSSVTCINSLGSSFQTDIAPQLDIQSFFRADRTAEKTSKTSKYKTVKLASQSDSTTCGFWTTWFCLGRIFGFSPSDPAINKATIGDVKETLSQMLYQYLSDPIGLQRSKLVQILSKNKLLGGSLEAISSLQQSIIAVRPSFQQAYGDNLSPFDQEQHKQILMAKSICDHVSSGESLLVPLQPIINDITLYSSHLNGLYNDDALDPSLMDALAYVWMRSIDPELQPAANQLVTKDAKLVVLSVRVGNLMSEAKLSKEDAGKPPMEHGISWFMDVNPFECDKILIPFTTIPREMSKSNGTKSKTDAPKDEIQWQLAVLDIKRHRILVYDSNCCEKMGTRRVSALYKRLHTILLYESRYHQKADLSSDWVTSADRQLAAPQVNLRKHSGILAAAFMKEVIFGRDPLVLCEQTMRDTRQKFIIDLGTFLFPDELSLWNSTTTSAATVHKAETPHSPETDPPDDPLNWDVGTVFENVTPQSTEESSLFTRASLILSRDYIDDNIQVASGGLVGREVVDILSYRRVGRTRAKVNDIVINAWCHVLCGAIGVSRKLEWVSSFFYKQLREEDGYAKHRLSRWFNKVSDVRFMRRK